jgi:ABC-2 type transport system permease protein
MSRYLAFTVTTLKEQAAFRINLVTSVFGGLFRLILLASVWRAIYLGRESLAGYRESDMLFYIVIAAAMDAGGLLAVGPLLGERNSSGEIVMDLVRPVSLPWNYFFRSVGDFVYRFGIKSVPTFFVGLLIIKTVPPLAAGRVATFFLLFLGGSFLHYWLNLMYASLSFRTKSSYGMMILWGAVMSFFSGLVVPINFYPQAVQRFILWTPFPSIVFTPLRVLMGGPPVTGGFASLVSGGLGLPTIASLVIEQVAWICVILPLSAIVYRWNERAVEVQGG